LITVAAGVGHSLIASVKVVPGCITPVEVVWRPLDRESPLTAVGQNENARSLVWGSGLACGVNSPLRIEPQFGKVFEDFGESFADMAGDIFENNEPWTNFVDDSLNIGPEMSRVIGSSALPGDGEWLAWVTGRDEIHSTAPRSAIEGFEIVPDRSRIQGLLFHPRHTDGRGERVPLDHAHGSRSEDHLASKVESSDSAAEAEECGSAIEVRFGM